MLYRRIVGIETPDEKKRLDQLTDRQPELKELCDQLGDYSNYEQRQRKLARLDIEKELNRIINQRRRRLRRVVWRAAVIVMPLIAAAGGAYLVWNSGGSTENARNAMPASWGATLDLGDGREFALDASDRSIVLDNGIEINSSSSMIDYQNAVQQPDAASQRNRLIVGRNQKYRIALNDGTVVWLNSESTLQYPVTFGLKERRVRVSGEAYFEVARDALRPFIVESGKGYDIEVLGTRFNVKAYESDSYSETTLLQGSIGIACADGERIILEPAQQMRTDSSGQVEIRRVNPAYSITWTEDWFYFEDKPLDEALEVLGRWYDVEFRFGEEKLKSMTVTGKLQQFELGVILDMLRAIAQVDFVVEGRTVTVTEAGR